MSTTDFYTRTARGPFIYSQMSSYTEFYEDLALWGVLTIGQNQKVELRPTIWQRFLDDLCHLYDTEPGGKTVISVAVSEEDNIRCFWISANSKHARAGRHLEWILNALAKTSGSSSRSTERIQRRLLDFVVRKSAKRVRNYMKQLERHVNEAGDLQHNRGGEIKLCILSFDGADFQRKILVRAFSPAAGL